MKKLKKIRIAVSLAFFLLLTAFFADVSGCLPRQLSVLEQIQFLPSLLSFNLGMVGFWLIASFLFGRVYCSTVCPMGTFQDFFGRLGKKIRKKKNARYRFSPAKNILRYSLLTMTAFSLCAGVVAFPALIDPYSAYGRIVVAFVRPLTAWIHNTAATDSTLLLTVDVVLPGAVGLSVAALTAVIVGFLAFRNGRTFCNTVCPVGATLSLCSRSSIWRMEIDTDKCINCHRCEYACKAACIDLSDHVVDMSRCVLCFNCVDVCNDDAITYTPNRRRAATPLMQRIKERAAVGSASPAMDVMIKEKKKAVPDASRRRFLSFVGTAAVTGSLANAADGIRQAEAAAKGHVPVNRRRAVTPPGTESRDDFLRRCTSCQLCVGKCPQQVLRPAVTEYGILHPMQPYMNFEASFCREVCNLCTTVCPTGALRPLSVEEKKTAAIGKAKFLLQNCVTQTDGVNCGACSRKCPAEAITMVGYNNTEIPQIDESACTGCGKCEYVCPATPYKAIYVEGIE